MAKSVLELSVGTGQWDAGLKKAQQALNRFVDASGGLQGALDKDSQSLQKFVRMMGSMESTATTAKGQMRDYRSSIEQLTGAYNKMTDAQKQTIGRDYLATIDALKAKFKDAKQSVDDLNKELGDTGKATNELQGAITTLGSKFGISTDLLSGLTTGTVAYTAAIGAAATAVIAAAKAFADYNSELAKQDNATMVVTGLKGGDADAMTSMARALSKTYDVDFRQTIEAANTLMSQFGVTSQQAMQLLRDGMQGMIQGDGPKLLSMIHQFAPAFQSAGVSASQLVAVIQNSEGGIFTDENMSAIVMGIKNIRLMTKQTSEALAKMGIDGEQMTRQLNDGTLTVFDALKQVAGQLKDVNSNSQTAGEVMQTVFGRQGAMAGTNLAQAIDTLNTNLQETKTQTGEVGEAFSKLETANERLEKAMRNTFEYDGWQTMSTGIKTELTDALTGVYKVLSDIRELLEKVGVTGDDAFSKIGETATKVALAIQNLPLASTLAAMKALAGYGSTEAQAQTTKIQSAPAPPTSTQQTIQKVLGTTEVSVKGGGTQFVPYTPQVMQTQPTQPTSGTNHPNNTKPTGQTKETTVEGGIKGIKDFSTSLVNTTDSLAQLRRQLAEFQAARANATNTADYAAAEQGIQVTQRKIGAQEAAIRMGVDTDSILEVEDQMKEAMDEMRENLPPLEIQVDVNTGKKGKELKKDVNAIAESAKMTANVVGSIGDAFNAIEDPAAKVAGTVAEAIASVALGYAQATVAAAQTGNPWVWIAFAASGLATMIASIASIKSATAGSYEEGGIVPGTSYHGDHLTAAVNSGEVILSMAQSDNLLSNIQSIGAQQSISGQPYTTGENIVLGINNHFKRSGQGEIVTTGMLRSYGLI